jgi:adenylyl cyclase-associated protein
MSEFHSLANLIKRLEVATTRLEDLAMSSSSASAVVANSPSSPKAIGAAPSSVASSETPVIVEKHDAAVNASLEKYIALSQELGGPIADQVRKLC